jgi:hypothetical protein
MGMAFKNKALCKAFHSSLSEYLNGYNQALPPRANIRVQSLAQKSQRPSSQGSDCVAAKASASWSLG